MQRIPSTQQAPQAGRRQVQEQTLATRVFELAELCQCDAAVDNLQQKFKSREGEFNSQLRQIRSLESTLKRTSGQYSDMSIKYYFAENAKLGPQGQQTGIQPEKTFEEHLAENKFQDKYLSMSQASGEIHPCFFYCSGKYSYYASLINDIREDIWHNKRYLAYLDFLLQQEQGASQGSQQVQESLVGPQ
jgi:hypothetical protein